MRGQPQGSACSDQAQIDVSFEDSVYDVGDLAAVRRESRLVFDPELAGEFGRAERLWVVWFTGAETDKPNHRCDQCHGRDGGRQPPRWPHFCHRRRCHSARSRLALFAQVAQIDQQIRGVLVARDGILRQALVDDPLQLLGNAPF